MGGNLRGERPAVTVRAVMFEEVGGTELQKKQNLNLVLKVLTFIFVHCYLSYFHK